MKPATNPTAAATLPHPGSTDAMRKARARAGQVQQWRRLKASGLAPAEAAARVGLLLHVLTQYEKRFNAHGVPGLVPHFQPTKPKPRQNAPTPASVGLGKRPRNSADRRKWDTARRLFVLGRLLQLRAQGYGYGRAAREIGCGTAQLWRVHHRFTAGGLLALEIEKPTGRPARHGQRKLSALELRQRKIVNLFREIERLSRQGAKRIA